MKIWRFFRNPWKILCRISFTSFYDCSSINVEALKSYGKDGHLNLSKLK